MCRLLAYAASKGAPRPAIAADTTSAHTARSNAYSLTMEPRLSSQLREAGMEARHQARVEPPLFECKIPALSRELGADFRASSKGVPTSGWQSLVALGRRRLHRGPANHGANAAAVHWAGWYGSCLRLALMPSFTPTRTRAVPGPRRSGLVACASAAFVAAAGCARVERVSSYPLVLRVESDADQALAGASVSVLGREVARTRDTGALALAIRGVEGEHVPITVSCPEGFVSPAQPTDVVLHRLADPGRHPEYEVRCSPVTRNLVVVVRADRGAGLPVVYLGRVIARTDASGAAHALVQAPANEEVELTLSTSEAGNERLRPQNPSIKFGGADRDNIKMFNVAFQIEAQKRSPPALRAMPIRLN